MKKAVRFLLMSSILSGFPIVYCGKEPCLQPHRYLEKGSAECYGLRERLRGNRDGFLRFISAYEALGLHETSQKE